MRDDRFKTIKVTQEVKELLDRQKGAATYSRFIFKLLSPLGAVYLSPRKGEFGDQVSSLSVGEDVLIDCYGPDAEEVEAKVERLRAHVSRLQDRKLKYEWKWVNPNYFKITRIR